MTAIDRAALIEAAAKAISIYQGSYLYMPDTQQPIRTTTEQTRLAEAAAPAIVASVLEPLREAHAGEWDCGNPSHTNPDVGCPDCLLYCASCDVEMPCPTVRLLDQIEADVKGGER